MKRVEPKVIYSELQVALELEKLGRMFELTAEKKKNLQPGLACAFGLLQLWAQKFAPSHPDHPYPNFGLQMKEVLDAAEAGEIKMRDPRLDISDEERKMHNPGFKNLNNYKRLADIDLKKQTKIIFEIIQQQKENFRYTDLRKQIPSTVNENSIRSVISRMMDTKEVQRITAGVYALVKPELNGENHVSE